MSTRPEIVTEDHLKYLDNLRESGVTNMWGAGNWLKSHFSMSNDDAGTVLHYWMHSFEERHPQ
jgi:hypothetical protein